MRRYILEFHRAPGDVLMMTALVRDLKLTYPDIEVDVRTRFPGLWRHNPHLTPLADHAKGVKRLIFDRPKNKAADAVGVGLSRRGHQIHYVTAFHRAFNTQTGMNVEPLFPYADIHLSEEERTKPMISGRYWVVVPGGKTDMTTKWWLDGRWQVVIDALREQGLACVQEGTTKKKYHRHTPMKNVLNLLSQTSIRDMIVNIHHAEGVICGCTLQMHIAGALQKPCVVLLGGREEPWWESYTNEYSAFGPKSQPIKVPHRVLHTVGQLDCCETRGCWRRRVDVINDDRPEYNVREMLCLDVVRGGSEPPRPKCMDMITPGMVLNAAMSYYREGYLKSPPGGTVLDTGPLAMPGVPPSMPPLPTFLRPTELQQEPAAETVPVAVKSTPILRKPPKVAGRPVSGDILDHPAIGGRFTACLLLYGDDVSLHRRSLAALASMTPPERLELRVVANQLGAASQRLLGDYPAAKVYWNHGGKLKFQAMREVFHDTEHPLTTPWVLWIDDVAFPCHPQWLQTLASLIVSQNDGTVGMLGEKLSHVLVNQQGRDPRDWFRRGAWFRDRLFRNRQGTEAGNGNCVHYASANFFAVSRHAIQQCDLPDPRLRQSGGGIVIGEQLHQNGFQIKAFNIHGDFVRTSQPGRQRGVKEPYPWQS